MYLVSLQRKIYHDFRIPFWFYFVKTPTTTLIKNSSLDLTFPLTSAARSLLPILRSQPKVIWDTLKANNTAVNTSEKKVKNDRISSWKCYFKCNQPTYITLNKFDTRTEEKLQACSLRQHCNRAGGMSALQTWDLQETLELHYQFYFLKEKFTYKFSRDIWRDWGFYCNKIDDWVVWFCKAFLHVIIFTASLSASILTHV